MDDVEWSAYQSEKHTERLKRFAQNNPDLSPFYLALVIGVEEEEVERALDGDMSAIDWRVLGDGMDMLEKGPHDWLPEERKLVDLLFSITSTLYSNHSQFKDREHAQAWVSTQLRSVGYANYPVGSSWGSLVDLK